MLVPQNNHSRLKFGLSSQFCLSIGAYLEKLSESIHPECFFITYCAVNRFIETEFKVSFAFNQVTNHDDSLVVKNASPILWDFETPRRLPVLESEKRKKEAVGACGNRSVVSKELVGALPA